MKLFSALTYSIDRLSFFFYKVTNWICLILVLLTAEQVVERYFFDKSSVGLHELKWHLFGFLFLLSAAYALKEDGHVRVDIFYGKRSERTKAIIDLLGILFLLLPAAIVVMYYGFDFMSQALDYENPRPADYYSQGLFASQGLLYTISSSIEGVLRNYILIGEISPDPNGLEARWIIRSAIPFGFLLLILQSISLVIEKTRIILRISVGGKINNGR